MSVTKTGKTKDGKQQYRIRICYKDNEGKFRQKERTAYGKDEAVYIEMQLRNELANKATHINKTVKQLYNEYMSNKIHEVRETSYEKTKRILEARVISYFGNTRLEKLSNSALQKWKNYISEFNLAITTRQNIYGEFRALLNYAVKMDYLPKNPLVSLGNFKDAYFEVPKEKIQYYTADEFKKYIECAKKDAVTLTDWGYYVFFNIAFYTGMRKGEINALKWSDVEGDILHVRRSVSQKVKGKNITETPPKNKTSYRDLQIPIPLKEILNEHEKRCKQIKGFCKDFRICGGTSCLSDTAISNRNIRFADEAGLHRIRIHDFRHSHATLLANEGINIQEIARRLGHSNIEMTWNTYSHLYPREEDRAIQILNKI